ncbi:hypothetical protein TELCIR_03100 [Teladorsagia circumcincta]|uniref:Uncharacterized protein n=1 Tax=Teladorsagia circumcincta TaxID=45464 RepID=A0A2G9UXB6_TELCI|nr:hypothetical protein TELCIR_03100 [Teladorsagia circumcincta]
MTFPISAAMNRLEYLLSSEKVAQEQAEKCSAATADAPPRSLALPSGIGRI